MTDTEIQKGDKVSWSWGSGQPSGEVAEVIEKGEIAIQSNRGNTIKKNADAENPAVHIARSGNDVVKRASEVQVDKKADGVNGGQANGESKKQDKQVDSEKKEEKEAAEAEKKDEEMKDAPAPEKKKGNETNGESNAKASKDDKSNKKPKKPDAEKEKSPMPETGEKRKAEDAPAKADGVEDDNDEEPAAKKAKTDSAEKKEESETKGKLKKPGRPKKEKKEKKEPANKKQPKKAATADGKPRRSARNKS